VIRLSGLTKSYPGAEGPLWVLKGIDLSISAGECVAIMGASGSGKSTLLNVLGLLDGYDGGSYHLDERLVRELPEREAARWRNQLLGFVFQSFHLLAFKDAQENVALPLYYRGVGRSERQRRAAALLERVGLAERAHHLPSQLSGGQKQRVAIARALIGEPKVILADEPTGALDSQTGLEILDLLQEVNRSGTTLLLVTHDPLVAERADRVIVLRDGLVERDGPPARRQP
jgi:putative ABC transport system ATP-binding protein